jgi:hypothetical protein
MNIKKPLFKKCSVIKSRFKSFGFRGRSSFYNVCKSLDATLNGFEIFEFWELNKATDNFISRVECILNRLEHE